MLTGCPKLTDGSPSLESISASSSKTVYKIGDSLDKSAVTVTAKYSDNTTQTVPDTDWSTDFDSATAGAKTVTVTYQTKTATFDVIVAAAETIEADIEAANGLIENEAVQAGLATADALAEEGAVEALTSVEDAQSKAAEIQTALDAYNALSSEAKALLPTETKARFEALAAILAEVNTQITKLAEETADPADFNAATDFKTTHATTLDLTVDTVAVTNKTAVEAALTAYNDLSAAVKILLPADTGTKLQALLDKIGQLETAAAEATANQQAATDFTSDHTAALALTVDSVASGNKDAVQAALTAYNGLSAEVKALLPADTETKLQALLDKITELETPAASGNSSITLSFSDRGAGAFSQNSFTLSKSSDETQEITLTGEWDSQKWVVDGKEKGTDASLEVKAADYSIGKHSLTVTVVKGDVPWSKTLPFTVGE